MARLDPQVKSASSSRRPETFWSFQRASPLSSPDVFRFYVPGPSAGAAAYGNFEFVFALMTFSLCRSTWV